MTSSTQEARLGELDAVLDGAGPSLELADELFALVDLLESQPALRRALTDPSLVDEARTGLVEALFGQRVSASARTVLAEAAARRWPGARGLATALEQQAVRALLLVAEAEYRLDTVEDELFRFARIVAGARDLRAALGDRTAPLASRQRLVADLLAGRSNNLTERLATRAVAARNRTFDLTVEHYLALAAALRARSVAHVVVARPLTDEQIARLKAALSRHARREVTLQVSVDPAVLGGAQVTLGDELIEGTVAGRLRDAHRLIG